MTSNKWTGGTALTEGPEDANWDWPMKFFFFFCNEKRELAVSELEKAATGNGILAKSKLGKRIKM